MHLSIKFYLITFFLLCGDSVVFAQSASWHGQISGWLAGNQESAVSLAGVRYIPDIFLEKPFKNGLLADAELSLNSYVTGNFDDWENTENDAEFKPYRIWARLLTNQFEARIGLQKINFGSATLFRPLMWFDRIDPRDPLKLTDGVYGLLLRRYFQNNANIWLWALYDNNDIKGWEAAPTEDNGFEFGGRLQLPVFTGEAGISCHHRRADFSRIHTHPTIGKIQLVDENRFAFDCKLDVKIGVWFEGSITHRDTDNSLMKYQRMWTVGADYTFDIGNGLNVLSEFFNSESSNKLFKNGKEIQFSGSSASYPVGLLDQVSGIYYYDWANHDNYILLNWQRTYDDWLLYFIGFINPETVRLNQAQNGGNAFSGKGFQIMVVFNH